MKTIDIKGKPYVMTNERIKYFRENYPNGAILTDLISDVDGKCIFKAEILVDGECVATGYAYENENSTFINKTSYIENCETSAVGRALGNLGIGLDTSVASADEVQNAIANQNIKTTKPPLKKKKVKTTLLSADAPEVILNIKRRLDDGISWEDIKKEIKDKYEVTADQLKRLKSQADG